MSYWYVSLSFKRLPRRMLQAVSFDIHCKMARAQKILDASAKFMEIIGDYCRYSIEGNRLHILDKMEVWDSPIAMLVLLQDPFHAHWWSARQRRRCSNSARWPLLDGLLLHQPAKFWNFTQCWSKISPYLRKPLQKPEAQESFAAHLINLVAYTCGSETSSVCGCWWRECFSCLIQNRTWSSKNCFHLLCSQNLRPRCFNTK